MKIDLKKMDGQTPDGVIVIYGNYIFVSQEKDFDEPIKELSHRHKLKVTDVFSEAIQLFYFKEKDTVVITENRKLDLVRLAQKTGIFKRLGRITYR